MYRGTKNLNQNVSLKNFLMERVYTETKTSTGKSSEKSDLEQKSIMENCSQSLWK